MGNPSFKITYRRSDGQTNLLSGYADSDWGNSSSRRSTSGMLLLYTKSPISWKSTRLSTAEAEYCFASTAAMEVLYLRYLLERLDFAQQKPTPVYEDNSACIEWGNNVIGGRERAKQIDIRKHFAHEVIQNGEMRLIKVPTLALPADILTKGPHLPQSTLCVERILGRRRTSTLKGTSVLKRGKVAKAIRVKSSHVGPYEECAADLGSQGPS
jgi:hypothetical protein